MTAAPESHVVHTLVAQAGAKRDSNQAPPRIPSTVPGSIRSFEFESNRPPPEPGQRVGRYLAEEVLGRGGMGLVLRARDDLLQREVAIKVILPGYLSSDPTAGLRFLREAEIVAHLRHPHIISVLDAGLDAGVAFLVFGYVAGPSFAELRNQGRIGLEQAVDMLLPIISAAEYAHRLGVVHGDLKPTNLILGRDYAGRPHPWVLDFGVSFFSGQDPGLDPTRGRITGTPGYLAPEWIDAGSADGRADCFSLGCVLYELLAGRGPFADCSRLSQAVTAAKERDYRPLGQTCCVPPGVVELIDWALAPEPDRRTPSARALGAALLLYASEGLRVRYQDEFSTQLPD